MSETSKPEEMSSSELSRLLESLIHNNKAEWDNPENIAERRKKLQSLHESFCTDNDFNPGDFVVWKQGFKNRKRPAYGEPAVVISSLLDPVYDSTDDAGSTYFREPLTLVLGLMDSDGDMAIFHYDARRFKRLK